MAYRNVAQASLVDSSEMTKDMECREPDIVFNECFCRGNISFRTSLRYDKTYRYLMPHREP